MRNFENWNEPDRWWQGRDAYFTPYQLTAMCSADYDGHMGPKNDWSPKPSWYYVYTLKNRLTGMRFHGEMESHSDKVRIYTFKEISGDKGAYVVWCPTSTGKTVAGYSLPLPGNPGFATLVTFAMGETNGIASTLPLNSGNVTLEVSETPLFVLVDTL